MDWQRELDALIVVNGGFFTPEYQAIGLIVNNGRATGTSLAGYGGMLAVTTAGAGVRSLVQQPYSSSEPLLAAVQSFPMLVMPGGQIGYRQEDGQADQRRERDDKCQPYRGALRPQPLLGRAREHPPHPKTDTMLPQRGRHRA